MRYALLLLVLASCAEAPPSPDKPWVACRYDAFGRWNYALVVTADDQFTSYRLRAPMSAVADRNDTEIRVTASHFVRRGYCPDEQRAMFGSATVDRMAVPR